MRTFFYALLLAVLCSIVPVTPAAAQTPPPLRDGLFVSLGAGWGSLGCTICLDHEAGVAGFFSVGGTVNDRIRLGVQASGWYGDDGPFVNQLSFFGLGYFYPSPSGGFFVKGGMGLSAIELEMGLGFVTGVGYDARVGPTLSLTPYVDLTYGSFDHVRTDALRMGLGITWH